jgi:hypothetical protein
MTALDTGRAPPRRDPTLVSAILSADN